MAYDYLGIVYMVRKNTVFSIRVKQIGSNLQIQPRQPMFIKVRNLAKNILTIRCLSENGKNFISSYNTAGWTITFISQPALPTLKKTKSGVQITLKKVAGAAKYRIFRKTGNGKWTKLADTTALKYVDKKAKKGVTYRYTVRCITKNAKAYTSSFNTTGKAIKCNR